MFFNHTGKRRIENHFGPEPAGSLRHGTPVNTGPSHAIRSVQVGAHKESCLLEQDATQIHPHGSTCTVNAPIRSSRDQDLRLKYLATSLVKRTGVLCSIQSTHFPQNYCTEL